MECRIDDCWSPGIISHVSSSNYKTTGFVKFEEDCWWATPTWKDLDGVMEGKFIGSYEDGLVWQPKKLRHDIHPKRSHARWHEQTEWVEEAEFAAF